MESSLSKLKSLFVFSKFRSLNFLRQDFVVNSTPGVLGRGNIELEKSKKEVARLQNIISELQSDLNNKRPISAEKKELQKN